MLDVTEQLSRAWAAVEGAGLPEHLHEVGFKAALNLQSPSPAPASPVNHVTPIPVLPEAPSAASVAPQEMSADPIALLAHETGIEQEALEEVFFFQDGLPGLNGPGRKLGPPWR
jgi:hypothetical protein